MQQGDAIKIALVDDHNLFRRGLVSLLEVLPTSLTVVFEAENGIEMQTRLRQHEVPDIILMDINMPGMDGFEAVKWLNIHYPMVNVLVISMIDAESSIIRMLKLGVKGYLSKDVGPEELNAALQAIMSSGFYYTDFITGRLIHALHTENTEIDKSDEQKKLKDLTDREKQFLQHACSEMTYNEIAKEMFLSPKTIDGYRNNLFEKLNVKNRVALAMYAVKSGLVTL